MHGNAAKGPQKLDQTYSSGSEHYTSLAVNFGQSFTEFSGKLSYDDQMTLSKYDVYASC